MTQQHPEARERLAKVISDLSQSVNDAIDDHEQDIADNPSERADLWPLEVEVPAQHVADLLEAYATVLRERDEARAALDVMGKRFTDRHDWCQPDDMSYRAFFLTSADPDCPDKLFTGPDAEDRAMRIWEKHGWSPSRRYTLFASVRAAPGAPDRTAMDNIERHRLAALQHIGGDNG